jgi:hypothetical protein
MSKNYVGSFESKSGFILHVSANNKETSKEVRKLFKSLSSPDCDEKNVIASLWRLNAIASIESKHFAFIKG